MNTPRFEPHPLEWTEERIRRFWDARSKDPTFQDVYFARQRGGAVLSFVRRHISLKSGVRVLDVGCGPGYFIERLLAAGISAEGVDLPEEAIGKLNERFHGHPQFLGAKAVAHLGRLPIETARFDMVFLLETIEHLLPETRDGLLGEIYRVLEPGGYLVLTTPNSENLGRETVTCSSCGATFHRLQHLASFTSRTLRTLLEAHGFRTVAARGAFLLPSLSLYLKAQRPRITSYQCPECATRFSMKESGLSGWLKNPSLRRFFHLIGIFQKPL